MLLLGGIASSDSSFALRREEVDRLTVDHEGRKAPMRDTSDANIVPASEREEFGFPLGPEIGGRHELVGVSADARAKMDVNASNRTRMDTHDVTAPINPLADDCALELVSLKETIAKVAENAIVLFEGGYGRAGRG